MLLSPETEDNRHIFCPGMAEVLLKMEHNGGKVKMYGWLKT